MIRCYGVSAPDATVVHRSFVREDGEYYYDPPLGGRPRSYLKRDPTGFSYFPKFADARAALAAAYRGRASRFERKLQTTLWRIDLLATELAKAPPEKEAERLKNKIALNEWRAEMLRGIIEVELRLAEHAEQLQKEWVDAELRDESWPKHLRRK